MSAPRPIGFLGLGYAGLTTALGLCELGHSVVAYDIDPEKIRALDAGRIPFHEPGLPELLKKHRGKRFAATANVAALEGVPMAFICVPTPSKADGSIDTRHVESAADAFAKAAPKAVAVMKSTVVPGTTERVLGPRFERWAVNPEFLREGSAVHDLLHPDRIVVGAPDPKTAGEVAALYAKLKAPVVRTTPATAEMIKYASNAALAAKISFANEMGNLAKALGVDVYEVMEGVGLDKRIGRAFLDAGAGFGGSCFPKDVRALRALAKEKGTGTEVMDATLRVNDHQPERMVALLEKHVGTLAGKTVAVLGLAFKPDTDDIRESRALEAIRILRQREARVRAYDPLAIEATRKVFPDIEYAASSPDALAEADGALVMTAWPEFRKIPAEAWRSLKHRVVVDGRRAVKVPAGVTCEGLCW
ncbi:MAG: UDP-glucose/GDP-mannose dehydrogenase family protein [Halobacteria archaeon]